MAVVIATVVANAHVEGTQSLPVVSRIHTNCIQEFFKKLYVSVPTFNTMKKLEKLMAKLRLLLISFQGLLQI